ncbi:2-oxo acid dehydrogenase subunit E2 [Streptacidiphilus anmyonensis]|uniref:2-oxo acid dehydrogenase subunit E2 n=1 Tax=Streptacidiphilus anmyonensis TaxID=405782 RepID=UPI000AC8F62D|nr:2-oxo acid dehydrogenase subunit E2 [Streptacidiphilus anmyonensis]
MSRRDRARRHTRYFLDWARSAAPVHLGAEVDMRGVEAHRAAARAAGSPTSVVSYLLYAAGRVLARHPEANAVAVGRVFPRTVRFDRVHAKLAVDTGGGPAGGTGGERRVHTAVLHDVDRLPLAELQRLVEHHRDDHTDGSADAARLLARLPAPVGRLAFRAAMARTSRRPELLGTVAVSSLGHRRVDTFDAFGGTAVTLTAGRIKQHPTPVLRLGLTFDHRVIDGAAAADVLDELVHLLEACDAALPGGWDDPRLRLGDGPADPPDRSGGALAPVRQGLP